MRRPLLLVLATGCAAPLPDTLSSVRFEAVSRGGPVDCDGALSLGAPPVEAAVRDLRVLVTDLVARDAGGTEIGVALTSHLRHQQADAAVVDLVQVSEACGGTPDPLPASDEVWGLLPADTMALTLTVGIPTSWSVGPPAELLRDQDVGAFVKGEVVPTVRLVVGSATAFDRVDVVGGSVTLTFDPFNPSTDVIEIDPALLLEGTTLSPGSGAESLVCDVRDPSSICEPIATASGLGTTTAGWVRARSAAR